MQLAGEGDHGAGAPAVAVENDVGVPFLPRGEIRSGPGAEQIHDQRVRVVEATILECFDVNGVGIGLTQISRDLHGRVYGIIVADVATEKADDDRPGVRRTHRSRFRGGGLRVDDFRTGIVGARRKHRVQEQKNDRGQAKIPHLLTVRANQIQ